MKIIFNAHNLTIGGGEIVGLGIIKALYKLNTEHEIHIFLSETQPYKKFKSNNKIIFHKIPDFFTKTLIGRLLSNFYLSLKVKKIKPEAIFSMGNYAIPVSLKQLLFLHWPYAVFLDSIAWKKMSILNYLKRKIRAWQVQKYLQYASEVAVQTPLMKDKFLEVTSFKGKTHVIESAGSFNLAEGLEGTTINRINRIKEKNPDSVFVLCISKYYDHKNLEIILHVAEKIKTGNKKIKIFTNLDPAQNLQTKKLLKKISQKELEDVIINLGHIPQEELYGVYKRGDAFLLPTLLESFGIIYNEAMIAGLPIFTSDLDFARYMCGGAAFYFDPLDDNSIYETLVKAFDSPEELKKKIAAGREKALKFKTWEEITKEYLAIIERLVQ